MTSTPDAPDVIIENCQQCPKGADIVAMATRTDGVAAGTAAGVSTPGLVGMLSEYGGAPLDDAEAPDETPAAEAAVQRWTWRRGLASAATAAVLGACLLMVVGGAASLLGLCRADVVLSGSMRPAFSPGSVVLAVRSSAEAVETGDVIVYLPPAQPDSVPVAHRVVAVEREASSGTKAFLTKGDSNPAPDPWGAVTPTGPVWVVKGDVPLVGHLAAALKVRWTAVALGAASLVLALGARAALTS